MFIPTRLIFFLIIFFFNGTSYGSSEKKLKLSKETINSFYNYISSLRGKYDKFLVTEDGTGTFVWACPQTLCFPASEKFYLKPCSKLNDNKPCRIFAINRKIKLKNSDKISINLRKFEAVDTLSEVKNKLIKLGFVD